MLPPLTSSRSRDSGLLAGSSSRAVVSRDRAVILVATSVVALSLRRTVGCTGLAITKPAALRGKPTTTRLTDGPGAASALAMGCLNTPLSGAVRRDPLSGEAASHGMYEHCRTFVLPARRRPFAGCERGNPRVRPARQVLLDQTDRSGWEETLIAQLSADLRPSCRATPDLPAEPRLPAVLRARVARPRPNREPF